MDEINLHEKLQRRGFFPEQELAVRKIVSTTEKGKRYILQTSNQTESVVYQIDGNIITKGNKCDKMVLFKMQY